MQRQMLAAWVGMTAVVWVLVGCETASAPADIGTTVPLTITKIHRGNDAGLPAYEVVLVNSQEELEALGSTDLVKQDIDFTNVSLVVFSLGEQPTGGYWAYINSVQIRGDDLYVQGVANQPGPNDMVAQVLTYPLCAVEIEKVYAARVHPEIETIIGQPKPR
ncbi:MAG: protease complex subunit PrcB family protein [Phycisphaeraceae bacterium]